MSETAEIAKPIPSLPVSFDGHSPRITKGQKNLLDLITSKLKEQKPITQDDISECYAKTFRNSEGKRYIYDYGWENGQYRSGARWVDYTKDHWHAKFNSHQWFKLNIGSCILKGKLVVIPVIELSEPQLPSPPKNR